MKKRKGNQLATGVLLYRGGKTLLFTFKISFLDKKVEKDTVLAC